MTNFFKTLEFFFSTQQRFDIPMELDDKPVEEKPIRNAIAPKKPEMVSVERKVVKTEEKTKEKKKGVVQTILQATFKKPILKDAFYSKWEQKYKALRAEGLLAKEPFNKHALFIIKYAEQKPFAEKICAAINSRLIKTTLVIFSNDLEKRINEIEPTHLIVEESIEIKVNIPIIRCEPLTHMKNDQAIKKTFWARLKSRLKK